MLHHPISQQIQLNNLPSQLPTYDDSKPRPIINCTEVNQALETLQL